MKENAKRNGVSESCIRDYIKTNSIDRRHDRKQNIIDDCRKYLNKHPKATWDEVQKKTGHSLSTIRKYREYIISENSLIDFDVQKAKKYQEQQAFLKERQFALLETIPTEVIREFLTNREERECTGAVEEKPKIEEVTILDGIPFNPYEEFRIPVNECIQFHSKALPENQILSNHYDCIITFRGVEFYALEQMYMALNYSDSPGIVKRIMACKSGLKAKSLCHKQYPDKKDWDFEEKRYRIIALCHLYKYLSVKEYRDRLRETYPQTLVECPNGKDYHFGMVQNLQTNVFEGNNCSGRTTMIVRNRMIALENEAVKQRQKELGRELTPGEREDVYEALYARVREQFDNDSQVLKDSKPLFTIIEKEGIPKVKTRRPKPFVPPTIDRETKCLVLDFDDTLFDTSADDEYRKGSKKDIDKAMEMIPKYKLQDGWKEVFDWTKRYGVKVAILSAAVGKLIEKALKHFQIPYSAVVGYQLYIDKPNPILGNMLMQKLNIREKQIIYVGNSDKDEIQARASQFRFLGATWHTNHKDYFANKGVQTVGNPRDIIPLLETAGWANENYRERVSKKDRGGYYTPPVIADFLLKWSLNGKNDASVLEPSCGDGVFLKELKRHPEWEYDSVTAIELDGVEATKASAISLSKSEVLNTDFYQFCLQEERKFDVVVGNPPYIRSHRQKKEQKELSEQVFCRSGLKVSKMASSWASFVVGATQLLSESGRLAMVVPADIMQVHYAVPIRQFLSEQFDRTRVVSFKHLAINGIQQDVVLLLCDRDGIGNHAFEQIELEDVDALKHFGTYRTSVITSWEKEFISTISRQNNIYPLSAYADVEVGITTGADKFFLVDKRTVTKFRLQEYARYAIGRSMNAKGAIVSDADCKAHEKQGIRCNLLVFPYNLKEIAQPETIKYIEQGEADGISTGYKTSIRSTWFVVPSVHGSDALFTRQFGDFSRLMLNEANVLTTGSLHRVNIKEGIDKAALVASFYNSLSFASVEMSGRGMGGGALALLPREVESVFLPYNPKFADFLPEIDKMLRGGKSIESILNWTDAIILKQGLGLSTEDIERIRAIWELLREHRKQKRQRTV